MRGLIQLFAAYGNFLLFLLLEGIALLLVVQFNQKQHDILNHSLLLLTTSMEHRVDRISEYIDMKEELVKLQGENQRLKAQLESAKFSNAVTRDTAVSDSLEQLYTYIAADVVSNSVLNTSNYLRLDRGSMHGVEPHMGVISQDGIVGVVRAVTDHYCNVMSILHRQTRIKAAIGSEGYFGTLSWDGKDPDFMQLSAVPKHANVSPGDTVFTSGYSQLFPPGLIIGTVDEVTVPKGQNFFDITVDLRNDIRKLQSVYIVIDEMRDEHQQLDEAIDE